MTAGNPTQKTQKTPLKHQWHRPKNSTGFNILLQNKNPLLGMFARWFYILEGIILIRLTKLYFLWSPEIGQSNWHRFVAKNLNVQQWSWKLFFYMQNGWGNSVLFIKNWCSVQHSWYNNNPPHTRKLNVIQGL